MPQRKRFQRSLMVVLLSAGSCTFAVGGCDAMQEFRAAAGDSLKTGVSAIADGLINGIFAVFAPDTPSSSSDTSNSTN